MGNVIRKNEDSSIDSGLIIIQGLYNSGKQTLHSKMLSGEVSCTESITGIDAKNLTLKNLQMMIFDLGSRGFSRPLMHGLYHKTKAVIFVIDSCDTSDYHLQSVRYELNTTLQEELLKNAVFVIMANKQDMAGAMTVTTLKDKLGLDQLKQKCGVFGCSALTGDGIYEAMKWLIQELKSQESDLDSGQETTAPKKGLMHKMSKMLSIGIKPLKQLVTN